MSSNWEQTPAGLLRGDAGTPGLATVAGPEPVPNAERFPDASTEYRAAWSSPRWSFQAPDGTTQVIDNAGTRDEMRRLAAEPWPGAWIDAPELGRPPRELRALYAGAAAAASARVGLATPGAGPDDAWEQMVAASDYAQTTWKLPLGIAVRID